jgi:squalene-hopene/tetraprenyl-beta-curcumene cyclase
MEDSQRRIARMNSNHWVQHEQFTIRKTIADKPQGSLHHPNALIGPVRQAILCARQFLFSAQQDNGQWYTLVDHDAARVSQSLLAHEILESKVHDEQSSEELVNTLVEQSLPQGGWTRLPGSTIDVSVSVLAYFALKIQGTDPTSPVMRAARSAILTAGGADQCNTTTRYWLALLGQISFEDCPPFPPERIILAPQSNLMAASGDPAATAEVNVALSVLWAHRPVHKVAPKWGVRELFIDTPPNWPPPSAVETPRLRRQTGSWWRAAVDCTTQWLEHRGWVPLRRHALLQLEKRLLERPQATESAAKSGQTIWAQIALTALGHHSESNELFTGTTQLNQLVPVTNDDHCVKSIPPTTTDTRTADVLTALVESGLNPHHGVVFEATGTFVDYGNKILENHEQVDATTLASLLTTLTMLKPGEQNKSNELPPHLSIHDEVDDPRSYDQWESSTGFDSIEALGTRLVNALVGGQNRDGSWTPTTQFRSGNDKASNKVAATGTVVIALSRYGMAHDDPSIRQASIFLLQTQLANGSWNHVLEEPSIHATSLAIQGLLAAGTTTEHEVITAGVNWLLTQQSSDGGWGDFSLSNEPGFPEPTMAVQSADAMLALLAADEHSSNQILRGIHFLLEQQQSNGSWHKLFFRSGSPAARCGNAYDLATTLNPLRALAHWTVAFGQQADQNEPPHLQLVGAISATDADW